MSDNKAPCYPWYPKDFSADEPVQLMTLAEEGAYRRLLDHQWLHGSVPGDIPSLSRICKNVSEREMKKMWPQISPLFMGVEGDSRLQNRRLERVRLERKSFLDKQSESGRRGAEARWGRRPEDGNPIAPALATPMANECLASASAIASAEKDTLPADAAPTHTHRSCLGLVVEKLYFGARPPEAAMRTEASIARALGERYGYDLLARAIEGLARRRELGEFPHIGPRQTVSLKWLNSAKFDINQLAASEDAYYRSDPSPRTGRGGATGLSDLLANFGKPA